MNQQTDDLELPLRRVLELRDKNDEILATEGQALQAEYRECINNLETIRELLKERVISRNDAKIDLALQNTLVDAQIDSLFQLNLDLSSKTQKAAEDSIELGNVLFPQP